MDGGGKELVNFSLGWGFFQTDDEVTNGWSVSQAQESYKRQREEEEALANKRQKPGGDQGTDGLDQGEWVENNWQDASVCPEQEQELWESDLLGKCDMCEEPSGHLLGLEESNILRIREKVNCSRLCEFAGARIMAATKSGKGEGRPQNELPPGPQIYVLSVFFSWVVPNGLKWCCMSRAFHFSALDTPQAYILTKLKSAPKRALLGAPGVL